MDTYTLLKPSEIRYSQDSINSQFREYPYKSIGETLDELYEGKLKVEDVPTIEVKKVNKVWYTYNNRRLWVFRHLERLGKCKKIRVEDISSSGEPLSLSTKCDGVDIEVRGEPGGKMYQSSGGYGYIAKAIFIGALTLGFRLITRS